MEAVVIKLLDISVSSCFIICAVLLLRLFLRKSPAYIRCLLWALVGLRLVMPFSIESNLSLVPSSAPVTSDVEQVTDKEVHLPPTVETPPVTITPSPSLPDNPPAPEEDTPSLQDPIEQKRIQWELYLWGTGTAAMLIYTGISLLRLRRKLKDVVILNDEVRIFKGTGSPFVLGVIKPRIYLSAGFDEKQMEYIISHEKAHIKRLDHIYKPLAFCILAVHWFNPLVWVAYFMFCKDMELACDEKVIAGMNVEERRQYSLTLLSCSTGRLSPVSPLAFGEMAIKERITKVMNYKKPSFWIIIVSVAALLVTAVLFITSPKTNAPSDGQEDVSTESSEEISVDEDVVFNVEFIESLPETGINMHVYTDPSPALEKVLITVNKTVTDFAYVELMHGEISGYHLGENLFFLPEFTPETKLCVKTSLKTKVSDRGITYTDEDGNTQVFALIYDGNGPCFKDINSKEHALIDMAGMKAEVGNLFADAPINCSEPDGNKYLKVSVIKEVKEFTFFKTAFHSTIGTIPGEVYCKLESLTPQAPFYAKLNIGHNTHGFSVKDDIGSIKYYTICKDSAGSFYFWDFTKEAEAYTRLQSTPPVQASPNYSVAELLMPSYDGIKFSFESIEAFYEWIDGKSEKVVCIDSYEHVVFSIYGVSRIENHRYKFASDSVVQLMSMNGGVSQQGKVVCYIRDGDESPSISVVFTFRNDDGEKISQSIILYDAPLNMSISEYWKAEEASWLEYRRFEKHFIKTKAPESLSTDMYYDNVEMALPTSDSSQVHFIFRGAVFTLTNHHGDFTKEDLDNMVFTPPYSWGQYN